MIKILKEGKIEKSIKMIYGTECSNCHCKFEFEIEDCKSIERRLGGDLTVECPCCHSDITKSRNLFYSREKNGNE